MFVRRGAKRVYIDKAHQQLRGLQGTRTVIREPIGTGIEGKATPNGIFKVQDFRSPDAPLEAVQGRADALLGADRGQHLRPRLAPREGTPRLARLHPPAH